VKARSWRWVALAGDSVVARRADRGLAVREVKVRAEAEGAIERNWPAEVGMRRARRPQRAMAGGQAVKQLRSFRAVRNHPTAGQTTTDA
jgi:hypothetical protein